MRSGTGVHFGRRHDAVWPRSPPRMILLASPGCSRCVRAVSLDPFGQFYFIYIFGTEQTSLDRDAFDRRRLHVCASGGPSPRLRYHDGGRNNLRTVAHAPRCRRAGPLGRWAYTFFLGARFKKNVEGEGARRPAAVARRGVRGAGKSPRTGYSPASRTPGRSAARGRRPDGYR